MISASISKMLNFSCVDRPQQLMDLSFFKDVITTVKTVITLKPLGYVTQPV